jgi:hypothetical protein
MSKFSDYIVYVDESGVGVGYIGKVESVTRK